MRFGPTSLKASSILAKGLHRPKFRSDLRISEQIVAGNKTFVVKILETNSYNRFGATEYELLTLCDGTRTRNEVAGAWNQAHPDDPLSEEEVAEFLEGVEPEMWEQSAGEKNLAVLERIRDERKSRIDQSSVLYISFKAWDPDKTLAKMDPYFGWLFTRWFVIFSIGLFITAAYLVAGDWAQVSRDTVSLYNFSDKTAYDIWAFWILLFGMGCIHELGHGLTCKHFGGDVHQMGFLLIYFTPAFFTDTTDIMLFDRLSRRQWVLLAGIWIELVTCATSAIIWRFTAVGTLPNDLAYKMMMLSGAQSALMNLNPLMKADGYYLLSEYLRVDNLRDEAFTYLRAWARKYFLREDIDLPQATRRLRRVYLIFGLTAVVYSYLLVILTIVFVRNICVSKFGTTWGYIVAAAVIYYFARKGLQSAWREFRAWSRGKREEYMAWKMTRGQQIGAVSLAVLFLIPPVPSRVASDFVLEPFREAHIRAEVPGMVSRVLVKQGDLVSAGEVIAVLSNPDLEARAGISNQQLAMADGALRAAEMRSDSTPLGAAIQEKQRVEKERSINQTRASALVLRAPFAGVISTQTPAHKLGQYLEAGDEFCEVVDRDSMKARILVRDWEIEDVHPGSGASLKVTPYAFRTYSGTVARILPATATDQPISQPARLQRFGQELTNYVAVEMVFPNSDGSLLEGMTGTAKIAGRSSPVAWQVGRGAWRWIRSQVW
jgi:putative peptide zinc metalloprotease protein